MHLSDLVKRLPVWSISHFCMPSFFVLGKSACVAHIDDINYIICDNCFSFVQFSLNKTFNNAKVNLWRIPFLCSSTLSSAILENLTQHKTIVNTGVIDKPHNMYPPYALFYEVCVRHYYEQYCGWLEENTISWSCRANLNLPALIKKILYWNCVRL